MRRALELAVGPALLVILSIALGSLTVFAVAVGLMIIYAGAHWATGAAATRAVLERRVLHHEVIEGGTVAFELHLAGTEGLPMTVEYLDQDGQWVVLQPGRTVVHWVMPEPGRYTVGPTALRIRDDLGLVTRTRAIGAAESLLVLPEPAEVPRYRRRLGADLAQDPEPEGLRPYVHGTPMNRIHWKRAARGGPLAERTFTTARDHLPLVVVDTAGARSLAAMDWAAREAAGHLLELARTGGCRVLLPGDRTPSTLLDPLAGWAALHRRLATLSHGSPRLPGGLMPNEAVQVRAALAPPLPAATAPLPPGVTREEVWMP